MPVEVTLEEFVAKLRKGETDIVLPCHLNPNKVMRTNHSVRGANAYAKEVVRRLKRIEEGILPLTPVMMVAASEWKELDDLYSSVLKQHGNRYKFTPTPAFTVGKGLQLQLNKTYTLSSNDI